MLDPNRQWYSSRTGGTGPTSPCWLWVCGMLEYLVAWGIG